MGYPPPIPVLRGKAAKQFLKDLENFELTDEQKEFYREAMKNYGKKCQPDCMGHFKIGYCEGCYRIPYLRDKYKRFDYED